MEGLNGGVMKTCGNSTDYLADTEVALDDLARYSTALHELLQNARVGESATTLMPPPLSRPATQDPPSFRQGRPGPRRYGALMCTRSEQGITPFDNGRHTPHDLEGAWKEQAQYRRVWSN